MRTSGVESWNATWIPAAAFVAPGPRVTMHTPGRPVSLPYASAIIAAPPSWRHTHGGDAGEVVQPVEHREKALAGHQEDPIAALNGELVGEDPPAVQKVPLRHRRTSDSAPRRKRPTGGSVRPARGAKAAAPAFSSAPRPRAAAWQPGATAPGSGWMRLAIIEWRSSALAFSAREACRALAEPIGETVWRVPGVRPPFTAQLAYKCIPPAANGWRPLDPRYFSTGEASADGRAPPLTDRIHKLMPALGRPTSRAA